MYPDRGHDTSLKSSCWELLNLVETLESTLNSSCLWLHDLIHYWGACFQGLISMNLHNLSSVNDTHDSVSFGGKRARGNGRKTSANRRNPSAKSSNRAQIPFSGTIASSVKQLLRKFVEFGLLAAAQCQNSARIIAKRAVLNLQAVCPTKAAENKMETKQHK